MDQDLDVCFVLFMNIKYDINDFKCSLNLNLRKSDLSDWYGQVSLNRNKLGNVSRFKTKQYDH